MLGAKPEDFLAFDIAMMQEALKQAEIAAGQGEIPVGAVVVKDQAIIAKTYNQKESIPDACAHAEILALQQASRFLGNWRLSHTVLYVTLEPCLMCAAGILEARVSRVVFGAYDPQNGALGSRVNILDFYPWSRGLSVTGGVLLPECENILKHCCKK